HPDVAVFSNGSKPERALTAPSSLDQMRRRPMRLATPFDPIEVGEIDNFAFDFTADMGASSIVSTSWYCALAPYQTATDPTPQSRVLAASARTTIEARSPIDGSLQMRNRCFSVVGVGGLP